MKQHEYNTKQHKYSTTQHEYNKSSWFTYIIAAYSKHGILKLKLSADVLKLRKLKIVFPVKAKIELESLKATVCCNCNINCIFLPI